jgi:hypothetical protein
MPMAIPAVVAAATAAAAGTTIFGLSVALSATLIGIGSLALNTLGAALAPKPKRQDFGDLASSQTQQVKQAITGRRVIYGEAKVSGAINYFGSSSSNKYLHIVLVLATHQCNYMGTTWFNDDAIYPDDLDANGNVISGKYAGKARIKKHLGQAGQIADPDLVAEISEITSDFIGNEQTYIYVRLEKDDTLYKSGLPNIQQHTQGALVYDPRTSTSYWSPNSVLCLRDYMTHTKYGTSAPASKFPSANIIAGANSCEEFVPVVTQSHTVTSVATASNGTAPSSAPTVTIASTGGDYSQGIIPSGTRKYKVSFVYTSTESITSPASAAINPSKYNYVNLTNIPLGGVGCTARKIYRTNAGGSDYFLLTTLANNTATTYADHTADSSLGAAPPAVYATTVNSLVLDGDLLKLQTGDRVQVTSTGSLPTGISAATNYYVICDQPVGTLKIRLASSYLNALARTPISLTTAGSGTITVTKNAEPRYTTNGTLGTAQTPRDNISNLLSAMAGDILPVGGKWIIKPAVWVAPTITIDDDDLCGAIEGTTKRTRRERFNAVQGIYVTPLNLGEPSDYPLVDDATYLAEDGTSTVPIIGQLDLPFTSRSQTAQRVARISLNRHRRQRTVQITTNMVGMQLTAGDTFMLTHPNVRYNAKTFEVAEFHLVPRNDKLGRPIITCDLICNETDSAIYNFDETTQEVLPAPPQTTTRPNPDFIAKPGSPAVAESKYITADGNGVKIQGTVTFAPSTDFFVRQYQVFYKLQSDADFTALPPSPSTTQVIYDLAPGIYDIQVQAISIFDAKSDMASSSFTIIGLSDLPGDVQGFSVISLAGDAIVGWQQTTDIDVRVSGNVRIRHTPDLVSYSWTNARDIIPAPGLTGISTQANVPLIPGVYMAKFVDSTGNESANAAVIIVADVSAIQMNAVASLTENPTFSGAKTNMVVSGGALQLDGAGLFDATSGNFDDAAGNFDAGAGVGQAAAGQYDFSAKIDCGKVVRSYVSNSILLTIFNAIDLFDFREGEFDSATGLFDGSDITGLNIRFFIRYTSDDPNSGSPDWTAWQPFVAGYFTARGYQFYMEVVNENSALQCSITGLGVRVDVPDVTDSGSVLTNAGSLKTVTYNKTFVSSTPHVVAVINGATSGDTVDIPTGTITSSNFQVGVLNSGAYVARNITWFARGY